MRKVNIGFSKEKPKLEAAATKTWANKIRFKAGNENYYDRLNAIDIKRVDVCSRHLYPGYFAGTKLGGKVLFHDNYFTGSDWVSGMGRVLRHCEDPDPPYLATQQEVENRYKPKRIRGLDFSGLVV